MTHYGQADSSRIATSSIKTTAPQLRHGQSFAWSYEPMSPDLEACDSIATNARRLRSSTLLVWLHSCATDFDPDATGVTQTCDSNWLHVIINNDVPRREILTDFMHELRDVMDLLCETYSIEPDRIYLVATGNHTGTALRLLFRQPGVFRGIALFNPEPTLVPELMDADERWSRVRALQVHTVSRGSPIREMFTFGRLLQAAGLKMTTHFCLPNRQNLGRRLVDWMTAVPPAEADWKCHW